MNNDRHLDALRNVLDYIALRKDVGNGIPADVVESVDILETYLNNFDDILI